MFKVFGHTIMITSFVFMMMLLIEYINVFTKGAWQENIREKRWKQYLIGSILGALPGCLGGFTIVSLYSHRIVGLGAVVATMIATSGDEAFVMFSLFPGKALILTIILIVIGIFSGFLTDLIFKKSDNLLEHLDQKFILHEEEECECFNKKIILYQLRNITFQRALLIAFLLIFLILLITGNIGFTVWDWKKITFLIEGVFSLLVVFTVPDHFLEKHLWEHVLKKHFVKIFLWTFAVLSLLWFLNNFLDVGNWIQNNMFIVLIIAVIIGIIPESGPHLIFVTMYAAGTIPLSILIASSIVQDGHAMLPMIAVSKKSFMVVKLINIVVGLFVGIILMFFFNL